CTAARSGTCDQRERGVRHLTAVLRDPKKKRKVVCFKAEARERGALPRRRRARRCCFRSVYFREPGGVLSRSRPTLQAFPSTSRKSPRATRSSCRLGRSLAARRS